MPDEPTVVIAEDDSPSALLLEVVLRGSGFTVRTAHDATEALAFIRESCPRLLLTDIRLPDMSGLELIRMVKANGATSSLKLIAVSAHAMPGEISAALAAGCDAYVPKPINTSELLRTIERILNAPGAAGAA